MKIKTGYLYHIKDNFFEKYAEYNLMQNHEKGKSRPTYFTIKDKNILWFIPISSKVNKYEKIINNKIQKYGFCNTILIREILEQKHAILLQNAFPTLEKYIDHVHMVKGLPAHVSVSLKEEILKNFKQLINMKRQGIDLFFIDIDSLKEKLLEEEKITV